MVLYHDSEEIMTNKFNVGDEVEIINAKYSAFSKGDIGTIGEIDHSNSPYAVVRERDGLRQWFAGSQIKLIESKPTKNQRITAIENEASDLGKRTKALEQEVAELKLIVAQIRKPSTVVEEALANDVIEFEGKQYKKVDREAREGDVVIMTAKTESDVIHTGRPYKVDENKQIEGFDVYRNKNGLNRTTETVDVYELIVEDKQQPKKEPRIPEGLLKTANQLRAEIIEKAKRFVDATASDDTHFEINGNQVLAWRIIRKGTGYDALTGVAVCSPNDVFNEDIGRAISVGRLEGLDVSEFEQAVQPDEIVLDMVVVSKFGDVGGVALKSDRKNYSLDYVEDEASNFKIINDTNAQYGGVE